MPLNITHRQFVLLILCKMRDSISCILDERNYHKWVMSWWKKHAQMVINYLSDLSSVYFRPEFQ